MLLLIITYLVVKCRDPQYGLLIMLASLLTIFVGPLAAAFHAASEVGFELGLSAQLIVLVWAAMAKPYKKIKS